MKTSMANIEVQAGSADSVRIDIKSSYQNLAKGSEYLSNEPQGAAREYPLRKRLPSCEMSVMS